MVVVPRWLGPRHPLGPSDGTLPLLVDLLLEQVATPAASRVSVAPPTAEALGGSREAAGAATGGAPAAGAGEAAPLDLRHLTASIGSKLAEAAAQQLEQAQAHGLLSQAQVLDAEAAIQAAVSGTAAVAAAAAALAEETQVVSLDSAALASALQGTHLNSPASNPPASATEREPAGRSTPAATSSHQQAGCLV